MAEGFDLSGAFEQVQQMLSDKDGQMQIQNILSMFSSGGGDENAEAASSSESLGENAENASFSENSDEKVDTFALGNKGSDGGKGASTGNSDGFDIETMLKISSVLQSLNADDDNPKTAFLKSLKPFLKESRQSKLEQAAKLMKIASVLKLFRQDGNKGGG